MRKFTLTLITTLYCSVFTGQVFAQSGATCNDAISETANNICQFTNYSTGGLQEMWFSFTATSTDVQIRVISEAFGTNAPHVHNISLFSGACGSLNRIAQDELPFIAIANDLTIDASELILGDTYHIRANVIATATACTRSACPGTATVSFALCIQDIDIILPLDISLLSYGIAELPSVDHVYYTNKGQIVDTDGNPRRDILSYTIGANPKVYVTDENVSYVFSKSDSDTISTYRVDMSLNGANPDVRAFKTAKVSDHLNYYLGHIPTGIVNQEGYMKIVCNDVYPNIDMQYYSNSEGMKIYFIVHPGGDPKDIELQYTGATSTSINNLGHLEVETPLGKLEQDFGHTFMIDSSGNISPLLWNAQYKLMGNDRIRFKIQNYPTNLPLIIQVDQGHKVPVVAASDFWITYSGGSDEDIAKDVFADEDGNTYMVGNTQSSDFPATFGSLLPFAGNNDVYIVKFDLNRERKWATYYGGGLNDFGSGVATDNSGNVYFTGWTSSNNFPICSTCTGFNQGTKDGAQDAFIVKLNSEGSSPTLWSTYFGGNVTDEGHSIAVRGDKVYITGRTTSSSNFPFPTTQPTGAYTQTTYGGNGANGLGDGFVAQFDTSNNLLWSTYWGGNDADAMAGCTVDKTGNLVVTGFTFSSGSSSCAPVTGSMSLCDPGGGATVNGLAGLSDIFIAKFSSQGVLSWSTMYGGSDFEVRLDNINDHGIAVDGLNNIWVVGSTFSTDLPLMNEVQNTKGGSWDMFALRFDNNGVRQFATYYGGSQTDYGQAIIADNDGNAYITGVTFSSDFPEVSSADFYNQGGFGGGDNDVYVVGFDQTNQDFWSTYLGGTCREEGFGMGLSSATSGLMITGQTASVDFPVFDLVGTIDYFDGSFNGGQFGCFGGDGFVGSMCISCPTGVSGVKETQSFGSNTVDMLVYPNPSESVLNIQLTLPERQGITLEIYEVTGKMVYQKIYPKEIYFNQQVDFSAFTKGIYLIKATAGDKIVSQKVIHQ